MTTRRVGARRVELRLQDPQPCVLPLYDAPKYLSQPYHAPPEKSKGDDVCIAFSRVEEMVIPSLVSPLPFYQPMVPAFRTTGIVPDITLDFSANRNILC